MSDPRQDVLARVKEALGAASLPEVAAAIGETIGAVKSWSARGSVPLPALIRVHEVSKRSLDWLILGDESTPGAAIAAQHAPGKSEIDCAFAAHGMATEVPPGAYAGRGERDHQGHIDSAEMAKAIDTAQAIERSLGRRLAADQVADMAAQIYRAAMAGKR